MATVRNQRAGIDDRWHRRVKGADGKTHTERSALYGTVSRWRVRWVDEGGRERTKVFARKPDAQRFLNGLTADIVRGEYVDPHKSSETFGAVAEAWFLTKGHRKPSTLAGYRSLLDTVVLPRWGEVPLKGINYEAYSGWLGHLAVEGSQRGAGLSASRITQAHQLTGAVLKYAQRTGKVAKNVALEFKRGEDLPQQAERERRYLTHSELLRLVDAAGEYAALTMVLGYCGIRLGEAAALRRKHVGDRELTIRASASYITGRGVVETDTKSRRERHVPVPEPVWRRLVEVLPADPNALVFPSLLRTGAHMTVDEYRWRFDKACAAVGIEGLTPHGLRHSTASLAISAGANVKVVQRLLGHASAAMTLDRYGHLFDDDLAGVADALSKAIESTAVSLRYSESAAKGEKDIRAGY